MIVPCSSAPNLMYWQTTNNATITTDCLIFKSLMKECSQTCSNAITPSMKNTNIFLNCARQNISVSGNGV